MLEIMLPLLVGALISWAVSWYFYNKQDRETPKWLSVKNITTILKQHPEDIDWTAVQILKLYKNKIHNIDESDTVPYGVCPECGENAIKHSIYIDDERDDIYEQHTCQKCGWASGGQI